MKKLAALVSMISVMLFFTPISVYAAGCTITTNANTSLVENVGKSGVGEITQVGESFTTTCAGDVGATVFEVWKVGAPGDNLVFSLQTSSANIPSGTPLSSVTVAGSSLSASAGTDLNLTFTTGTRTVTNGTEYAIVAGRDGGADSSNYYRVGGTGSGSSGATETVNTAPTTFVPIGTAQIRISVTITPSASTFDFGSWFPF